MSERKKYGEVEAAKELAASTTDMKTEAEVLAAVQKSVELGIRSILFYAVELVGLKDGGTVSVGKVDNGDVEYEVTVTCKKKSNIILLGGK